MLSKELKDVLKIQKKKLERYIELKNKIFSQVITKINNHAKLGLTHCVYTVPHIVYGFPSYDISDVRTFLINKLIADGFRTILMNNGNIYISWDIKDVTLVQSGRI